MVPEVRSYFQLNFCARINSYFSTILVYRSIGTQALRNLDPFLMLDEFDVKAPAGFPDHVSLSTIRL